MISSPEDRQGLRRVVVGVSGLMLVALLFALAGGVARADTGAARDALARGLTYLKAGNATAARSQALDAVREAPSWGLAHAVLAESQLELGDGAAAEGALDRAVAEGFQRLRSHQLYARAYLLQGDADRALAELDKASPRYRRYSLVVRGRALAAKGDFTGAFDALDAGVKFAPRDPDIWTALADIRRDNGNLAGAIAASKRAVALGPDDTDALIARGRLVRAQYGLVASLAWFEAALKRDPWRYDALIEYGATLGDAGRASDMLAAVRKAMKARPGAPQGYYLQAVLAARAGEYDLARAVFQRAGGALDAMPGALLLEGSLDIEAGSYQQAIESLGELVARQPFNLSARKLLGLARLRAGAPREAVATLRPMALRGDADGYTLHLVARAFEAMDDRAMASRFLDRAARPARGTGGTFGSDDSLTVLRSAAEGSDAGPADQVALLRGLVAAGRTREALARASGIADANPGSPDTQLLAGDVAMAMGREAAAAERYARAADIRFDEPVMLRLVEALDASGERERAAHVLALFLSQNPVDIAALRLAAHWQLAAGDFHAAIATLERVRTRIGDRDAVLLAELATAHAGAGDSDKARRFGAAAYDLAPANPSVADAYGWVLHRAGDDAVAVQLMEKAVAIAPAHAGLRWHLAQVYAALGRKSEAAKATRTALADSSFSDRSAAKALLAELA